jgi:hypothetical protein
MTIMKGLEAPKEQGTPTTHGSPYGGPKINFFVVLHM